jgi:hypothetical protein
LPTLIFRLWRRGASTGGGALGIPRETAVMVSSLGFGAEDAAPRRHPPQLSCTGATMSAKIRITLTTRITIAIA